MEIKNLTPHTIVWVKPNGDQIAIPSTGIIRCQCTTEVAETIGDLVIFQNKYVLEDELPAPKQGVFYIVSALVASQLSGKRDDVLVTNDTVRDESGRIIGCRSFARI